MGSGIGMCIIFTLRQVVRFVSSHAISDLLQAVLALLGAIGIGFYLRSLHTRHHL